MNPIRGTHDLWPVDAAQHRRIVDTLKSVSERFGFGEIATPLMEFTPVFQRTLGDTSDIVTKEMYTFADRNGESITLRPEGTAGVARAFISAKAYDQTPLKLWYTGAMFRYERPQKGRQRQFHQVGVEVLGASEPLADVEVLVLAQQFLQQLGITDVQLQLNTLGDAASREAYRVTLTAYLEKYRADLSEDSQARLARNPLRILDSKDDNDKAIVADAPRMADSLTAEARAFFDSVLNHLTRLGIVYTVNPQLVRGLDYYSHTAFEFVTTSLGAQGTVLAGGRYDGLIELMGGRPTAGIGWAAGIERLALMLAAPALPTPAAVVVPMSPEQEADAYALATQLRQAGLSVEMAYAGNASRRLKKADKLGARYAVMLGEQEQQHSTIIIKDLHENQQISVAQAEIASWLLAKSNHK
jgi:histidyl-tRNA synthetase